MNSIALMIIVCEILFWIVIILGLLSRYKFNQGKLSIVFFMSTPLIDLALLLLTATDLKNGASATIFHGIAAIYIGVSLTYGKRMIRWADRIYRTKFLKQPSNEAQLYGMAYAKYNAIGLILHIAAFAITGVLLLGIEWYVGDSQQTETLFDILSTWKYIIIIDVVITSTYFIWPKAKKA